MAVIKKIPVSETRSQYLYMCPGCGYDHAFAIKEEGGNHIWNWDFEKPTISPSLLQNWTPGKTCHSFIRNGMIQYLSDCDHHLKGQTIPLPNIY